jgi:uncharacterized membrane protein
MNTVLIRIGWGVAAFLCVALFAFSYRWLPGVGPLPEEILANRFATPWLLAHVIVAPTALLLGLLQFIKGLRTRHSAVHRWIGRIYVTACLAGAGSGFMLSLGSTGGPVARTGFAVLAVCWFAINVQGWLCAVAKRFVEHRAWMIRSFALTFAAVTLRIYLTLLPLTGLSPENCYNIVAWISWVPNLILAELWLRAVLSPGTMTSAQSCLMQRQ